MMTISEISPSPVLAPFIRSYSHREFDTKGQYLVKPTHAQHEMILSFHFKDKPVQLVNREMVKNLLPSYGGIVGLATEHFGEIIFKGCYSFFEITFKPNGFNKIFKLPPSDLLNGLTYAVDIFGTTMDIFYESLSHAKGLNEMAALTDAYLLRYLKKQLHTNHQDSITCISNLIIKNAGMVSVDKLAYEANMSIRTLERHFIEQIGIPPKLFCNITRFNHALALKMKHPQMSWTSIALECGYFDQMHLIRDFKKFSPNTPSVFLKNTPFDKDIYTNQLEA